MYYSNIRNSNAIEIRKKIWNSKFGLLLWNFHNNSPKCWWNLLTFYLNLSFFSFYMVSFSPTPQPSTSPKQDYLKSMSILLFIYMHFLSSQVWERKKNRKGFQGKSFAYVSVINNAGEPLIWPLIVPASSWLRPCVIPSPWVWPE